MRFAIYLPTVKDFADVRLLADLAREALEQRGQKAPGLLVVVLRHPSAALEAAAPVLVGAPGPWYTPSTLSIIVAASFMVIAPCK